ncbi:hypothetical protein PGB90_007771 [Kerria lacca]
MNFISCVKWVKQGVTKNIPDNVNLNENELNELMHEVENEDDENDENEVKPSLSHDEYNFENYDKEDDRCRVSLKGIATFNKDNKKRNRYNDNSNESSDKEDETIKDDDNLILVGHVDNDMNSLEVYVYNENDGDMYIHHDLILKAPPLCIEWLFLDSNSEYNNICAVGSMKSVIEFWDLDVMNCVEPIFKLGRSKKRNPDKNYGHTDAVLSIAWNTELTHILSSGSVDCKTLLWDLDEGKVSTEINVFSDKVQTLLFNPHSPFYLLTGCADGYMRNFDCRVYNKFNKINLSSSVESIVWDINNEFCCFAGTSNGKIYYLDFRTNMPIWSISAHNKEVTGLNIYKNNSKILVSVSADELVKYWEPDTQKLIYSKDIKIGPLQCMDINPNYPYLACIGGFCETNNKKILNVINIDDTINSSKKEIIKTCETSFKAPLLEKSHVKFTKLKKKKKKHQ